LNSSLKSLKTPKTTRNSTNNSPRTSNSESTKIPLIELNYPNSLDIILLNLVKN
jgi:hypothetical protein